MFGSRTRIRYLNKKQYIETLDDYKKAKTPIKVNSILYAEASETFLKEVYTYEKNAAWRKICLKGIHDQYFLNSVAKNDPNEGVRKQAAIYSKSKELIYWLMIHDHSPLVRNYAKKRWSRLPNSIKFILS